MVPLRLAAAALALVACRAATPTAPAAVVARTRPAARPATPGPAAPCGLDVATRSPGAEADEPVDLDADGDLDLIYRGGDDMFGNAEFLIYRIDGACAVYLGSIESFVTSAPRCERPPAAPGELCLLVARRRMMHDDYQDTFYAHGPGGFVEAGHGEYIAP